MSGYSPYARFVCVSIDVQGYGSADDPAQEAVQGALVGLLEDAAAATGLDRSEWLRQGKGDEELALVPVGESEPRLIDDFPTHLTGLLVRRNLELPAAGRFRLRMAVDVGLARVSVNGFAGQSVVAVSRLVGAAPLRAALAAAPGAAVAMLVSDRMHQDLVRAGHTRVDPGEFRAVEVKEKEYVGRAWLRVPGVDVAGLMLTPQSPPATRTPSGAEGGESADSSGHRRRAARVAPAGFSIVNGHHNQVTDVDGDGNTVGSFNANFR